MRLTLRTMLAYMDDILEPEDAQDLGKKIEESEFASNLLARARDVMRRLRLGAPGVGEGGAVLDPNTVAEYLDNTLSSERVPDFEKVCLESDVHLAEVAACHQILTLVLGEPAEVDQESRQQMYQLPAAVAAKEKEVQPTTPEELTAGDGKETAAKTEEPAEPSPASHPSRPTVPDYLREPPRKRRFWPVAAALFLTGFFAVVVLAAMGQFEPGTPLGKMLGLGDRRAVVKAPDTIVQPPEVKPEPPEPEGKTPEPAGELQQPEVAKPAVPEDPVDPTDPAIEKAPTPEDVAPAPEPPVAEPGPEMVPKPEVAPEPPAEVKPEPAPKPEAGAAEPNPDMVKTEIVDPAAPKPAPEGPADPAPEVKPPVAKPEPVLGQLVSEKEVLVRLEPAESRWMRVPAMTNVSGGQRLLALPTYRPMIALTALTVQLVGGTQVAFSAGDAEGSVGLSIPYGKVVLRSVGKAGTKIRVDAGGRSGILTLTDPDSAAAVVVSRQRVEGADPELQPDPVSAELLTANGRVTWSPTGDGQPVLVESSSRLALGAAPADPVRISQLPAWIDSDTTGLLDRSASGTIEQALVLDRPTQLGLKELLEHRKREVRWLAMRCLGYFGDFDVFIASLNNPDDRLLWPDYIDLHRQALQRGPQVAVAIRQAAEKRFGQEGAALARMLYGYTNEGLKAGDAGRLVGYLDHPDLAFRELAFWNLKGITGWGLFYQPEAPEAKRKQSVQKWRERLEAGAITRTPEKTEAVAPAAKPEPPTAPLPLDQRIQ